MNIRKQPGSIIRHEVSAEDMALINSLSRTELRSDQVYTFAIRLCDNEIDRDWERFDENALKKLSRLFIGKSGIFDHNWSAGGQTARLYKTEVCREEGETLAGDPCRYLKGYAYMLRSEKNNELIEEIEAGIKKEVSVGCSVAKRVCSGCGQNGCGHQGGRRYDGRLCWFTLQEPTDAYEWSFVAVPSQRKAGVIKGFEQDGLGLRRLLAGHPGYLEQWEELEREAEMGRSYMTGLRKELVRLAGMADETMDLAIFSTAADRLTERELKELTRVYKGRVDAAYGPEVQLKPRGAVIFNEEDKAFQV